MEIKDFILVQKIKAGNRQAFEVLVKRYYQNIYAYCFRRCGNKETAQDLTQDIFVKLISSIYRYTPTGKFQNFLFTIAVNTCNDYHRKSTIQQTDVDIDIMIDSEPFLEDSHIKKEEHVLLCERLQTLPDIQKNALILYYYHDLKIKDIATITGVSVSTVKSRIHQGIGKLKKIYRKDGEIK